MGTTNLTNVGYTITDIIGYGDVQYVLGHNSQNETSKFVTWRYFGDNNFEWGHYFENELDAKKDLIKRTIEALPELQEEKHNIRLEIVQDTMPKNPRKEYDNFATMVCWHSKYDLGDKHNFSNVYEFKDEVNEKNAVIMPIHMYEHGSIALSTRSFSGRAHHANFDSGVAGFIYAAFDDIKKEFGDLSEESENKAIALMNGEVEEYGHYLNGEVYGYKILDNDNEIESCWGFIGDEDDVKAAMRESAPEEYQHLFDEEQTESYELEAVQ